MGQVEMVQDALQNYLTENLFCYYHVTIFYLDLYKDALCQNLIKYLMLCTNFLHNAFLQEVEQ